jgi:alginate O-acetyltransferase complex protein AlgI
VFDIQKILHLFQYDSQTPLLFTTGFFLFVFAAMLSIYALIYKKKRVRILFFTFFSTWFYYKSSGNYFLLLVASVIIDYNLARWIDLETEARKRKMWLVLSLVANLGMLAFFKYTNYFGEMFAAISGKTFDPWHIFLPVGVSFFTFQSLSYTIDVYRKEIKSLESIWDYAFFVTFFPQMMAGPIVRAADFLPQISRIPTVSRAQFGRGVWLVCTGLFKKAVIADYLSVNFVDRIFDNPALFSGIENLIGAYGYAMQIYCDFSGYSDMAIGIALLLGFQFPPNFMSPYQSGSITEFWRRWHISLSTWLRDYLYIPLGGNRDGGWKTYRNLLITMLLGGLWHGAANRFLIWGGLHGAALAVERGWKSAKLPTLGGRFGSILRVFLTFHFVVFCWLFFRAQNLESVGIMLGQIFGNFQPQLFSEILTGYAPAMCALGVGFLLHFLPEKTEKWAENIVIDLPILAKAAFVVGLILLVMQVKSSEVQPFIYFQF